jgi:hypothetical protein
MVDLPRGKILDTEEDPVSSKPIDTADKDHFMKCPPCGGWIDCRDLAIVLAHHGPLPHPVENATD